MKLDWVLFILLLAMCAALGAAFFIEERPNEAVTDELGNTSVVYQGHGVTHGQFKTMQAGGSAEARNTQIFFVGSAYGALLVLFFVAILLFGMRKNGSPGWMARPILFGGAVYFAVYAGMIWFYWKHADAEPQPFFMNLPVASAWMIYGLWVWPLFFLFLFMWSFDRWNFTEEDEKKIAALVAARRGNGG